MVKCRFLGGERRRVEQSPPTFVASKRPPQQSPQFFAEVPHQPLNENEPGRDSFRPFQSLILALRLVQRCYMSSKRWAVFWAILSKRRGVHTLEGHCRSCSRPASRYASGHLPLHSLQVVAIPCGEAGCTMCCADSSTPNGCWLNSPLTPLAMCRDRPAETSVGHPRAMYT